jgi:hypothetical protein
MPSQPEIWIGLVEFKPFDRKAHGAAGAFTNIVTWACDATEFRRNVEIIAAKMDFYVAGIEDAGPFAERTKQSTVSEEIEDMVLRAESNPNAIIYGTFHQYPFDGA